MKNKALTGPSGFITAAMKDRIIELLSNGELVTDVAEELGISMRALHMERLRDAKFGIACIDALDLGAEVQADDLLKIPQRIEDTNKARLLSDNSKWLLSRRHAKRYGDRVDINVTKTVDVKGAMQEARERLAHPLPDPNASNRIVNTTHSIAQRVDADSDDACETKDALEKQLSDLLE